MIIVIISILVLVSGLIATYFRMKGNRKLFGIFKPITTILIIALAIYGNYTNPTDYSIILLYALAFSLIGDMFLVFEKYFLQGLISFFIAHIAYAYAFATIFGFDVNLYILGVLILVSSSYYIFIYKFLGTFKIPLAAYFAVILIMNLQAQGLMFNHFKPEFIAIAIGSVLFSLSDAVIAFDKFKIPFKISEPIILVTYWLAIYIFALVALYI